MTTPMTETVDTQALLSRIAELEQRVAALEQSPAQSIEDRLAMVVFSGDLDKAIAAFIIATGAASMGLEVSMFFTFWGISAVKKQKVFSGKNLLEQGFTAMLPGKLGELGLSQMNFFGAAPDHSQPDETARCRLAGRTLRHGPRTGCTDGRM